MNRTNDVYRKIKEISGRSMNPRPLVLVPMIAQELLMGSDELLPCLNELKELRLIKTEGPGYSNIKLTLLGTTVKR